MGRTVPETPNVRPTRRLERLAHSGNRNSQPLQKRDHRSDPHRSTTRVLAQVGLLGTTVHERASRGTDHQCPSEASPGQSGDQSLGRGTSEQTIRDWRQSLARRQESETPLSKPKVSPEKVWTVSHHPSHLPSSLSIGPPPIMDDPQRVPRRPALAVSRNKTIRSQLPETTPQTSSTEKRNMKSRPSETIDISGDGELSNT